MKCRSCRATAEPDRTQCQRCLIRDRRKSAARRSIARSAGVCVRCESAEARSDRDTCFECAREVASRATQRRVEGKCTRHDAPSKPGRKGCELCLQLDRDRYQRLKAMKETKTMPKTPDTFAAYVMTFPPNTPAREVLERARETGHWRDRRLTVQTVYSARFTQSKGRRVAAVKQGAELALVQLVLKHGADAIRRALEVAERVSGDIR